MGLDMYMQIKEVDTSETIKIFEYRKFNALHGLMRRLGYIDDLFDDDDEVENALILEEETVNEVIQTLENVLENKSDAEHILPIEHGFFFGSYEYDDYYFQCVEQALADFTKIQEKYTSDEFEILYDASW